MVVLITSNGIYIYFIAKQVENVNNDKIFLVFGDLICFIEGIAVSSTYLHLNLPVSTDFHLKMEKDLKKYQRIEDTIADEENNWGSCPGSSRIFNEKYLKIYDGGGVLSKKMNLHDFVLEYRKVTERFLNKTRMNEEYQDEYSYIVNNGIIGVPPYLKVDFDSLVSCSKIWIESFKKIKQILLTFQISLTFTCFFMIIYKVYQVVQLTNRVWNRVSDSTFTAFYDIRNKCIHRLTSCLETSEEEASLFYEFNRVKKNIFEVKIVQILPYFWRISIFMFLSGVYFLLVCYVQSVNIETLITNNRLVKHGLFHKSELILEIDFWTISSFVPEIDKTLKQKYFEEAVQSNEKIDKIILNPEFKKFFKSEGLDFLYKHYDSNVSHGLLTNSRAALFDSFYIFHDNNDSFLDYYSKEMQNLFELNSEIIKLSDNNGKDLVNNECWLQVVSIVLVSIFCFFLYICLYYPFLNDRTAQLMKMKDLSRMFVSNSKDEQKKQ
jgi:hypothetical protein